MEKICHLKVGALLWEEAAGGRAAAATFSLAPKKGSRIGDFGRRSPSPGKCRWRPFAGQVRPSQAPSRQAPKLSDARASGPARAAQGAERAGRAGQPSQRGFRLPVANVRERAPRLTLQDKLKQIKSGLHSLRSTPPPSWFDPRPGRSKTWFAQLRLQATARYRQGKGAPPREGRFPSGHDLVARESRGPWVTGDRGGAGGHGGAWPPPSSAPVLRAGPGREARGRKSLASLIASNPGSKLGSRATDQRRRRAGSQRDAQAHPPQRPSPSGRRG